MPSQCHSAPQLQQLESSADEESGEAHVARSRPCGVAPRAPEDEGHIAKLSRGNRSDTTWQQAFFFFAREAQAAKSLREAASPGRPSMESKNSRQCVPKFSRLRMKNFAVAWPREL